MTGPYRIAPEFDRKDTRELRKFLVVLAWTPPSGLGVSAAAKRLIVLAKDGSEALCVARVKANNNRNGYKECTALPFEKIWFSEVVSIEDFYINKEDRDEIERLNSKHSAEE